MLQSDNDDVVYLALKLAHYAAVY